MSEVRFLRSRSSPTLEQGSRVTLPSWALNRADLGVGGGRWSRTSSAHNGHSSILKCPGCTTAQLGLWSVGSSPPPRLLVGLVTKSHLTLCSPMDCSPPGSSVHGVFQARIPEWVAISSSRGSSQPRDQTASLMSPVFSGGFFTSSATWEALYK